MPADPKKIPAGQNIRSKALPDREGKPRDTSAKGFKRRTTGIGGDRQRLVGHEMVREAAQEEREPMPAYRAEGFARAVDLSSAAEARQRLAPMAVGPLTPSEWHDQVIVRAGDRCAVTELKPRQEERQFWDCHHTIPKGLLKRRGLHGWIWDARIGMYLVDPVHDWFDDGTPRFIPGNVLPPEAMTAAAEMDAYLGGGTSWAQDYLRTKYPVIAEAAMGAIRRRGVAQAAELGIRGSR